MRQATVIRYSMSFKQQVIRELEAERFQNVSQAREHYGINGAGTISRSVGMPKLNLLRLLPSAPKWLARYGRNHLCSKVVRIEMANERDQVVELKKQIRQLKEAMVSDITYIRTREGFVYLCLVMDAYSRAVVGYDCSDSLESQGALRALSMALKQLPASRDVVHHSDRGCQYCSGDYVERLKSRGMRISMTEENHCYENGKAERLNGILKEEYGLGGSFLSKSAAYRSVRDAIVLYNCRRPHQSPGYRCPMEVHLAA